jgi:DNA-binding transcriptional ArsR family regulator
MQIADATPSAAPSTTVLGPSLALDLGWCLHAANSVYLRGAHPALNRLYQDHPGLEERVLGFWATGTRCFAEMEILALHARALDATDFPTFRAKAIAGLATVPKNLEIASETDEDRSVIHSRLAELRRSPSRRTAYFDLLADVWSGIADWWGTEGVEAVERRAAEVRNDLARGLEWYEIVTTECEVFSERLPEIIERHQHGDEVVLAPCALFGRGLYLDIAGCSLVGFAVGGADKVARARTEQVVRRLRALADPTRLAIFDYLKTGPSSVGEISTVFSLAQPTVSVHLKHLREAGLVSADRNGPRLEITVNRAASELLAEEFTTLMSG